MKKFLSLFLAFLMILLTFTACNKTPEASETQQTDILTLAGKTPKEAYDAAVSTVESMSVFDIYITTAYTSSYLDNSAVTNVKNMYMSDGTSYFYSEESDTGISRKMWYVNGSAYSEFGDFKEKLDMSVEEYKLNYFISASDLIFTIDDTAFTDAKFIQNGDNYELYVVITPENYYNFTHETISENADCKMVFDAQGNMLSFGIVARNKRPDSGIILEVDRTIQFKSIGGTVTVSIPENLENFRLAPKMEDLDMTSLASDQNLVETEEKTDLVKLKIKNFGDIVIRLYPTVAPQTVENFKELVSKDFYDDLIFHRIIKDSLMQGGDPEGTGMGGSEQKIKGEFAYNGFSNNLLHKRGVVSMARTELYDSASSQFFIVHTDNLYWDGQYAAFGYVVRGMDVVDTIVALETDANSKPLTEVRIETACFVTVCE